MNDQELKALVDAQKGWMIEKRRQLHRIPEQGFAEYKTQRAIMDALKEIGIPYQTERTWVIGLIEGAMPGETVALRADMDALPLSEPEGRPFRSEHEGMMHACGHDAHMAMVLGAAKLTGMFLPELPGCQRKNVPAKKNDLGRYVKQREGAYHDCG